jgi:hypothetical protein
MIQSFQHDAQHIQINMDKLMSMEPYLSKHRLWEYDNMRMQNTRSLGLNINPWS